MNDNLKDVKYSYEHGDKTLPKLVDLVSETPEPHKKIILSYLETNCILASPGIITDRGQQHLFYWQLWFRPCPLCQVYICKMGRIDRHYR